MSWYRHLNGELVGFVVTVLIIMVSLSASYGVSQHQLNKHDEEIETIKKNVDSNQNLLIEVRNDVKWLRHKMATQP